MRTPPADDPFAKARVARMKGDWTLVEAFAREAWMATTTAPAAILLGEALIMLGQPLEAEHTLRSALLLEPKAIEAMILLGRAAEGQGRGREAQAYYEEALRLDEGSADARYLLAQALARGGDAERALAQLVLLTRRSPDYADGWRLRGALSLGKGEARQAASDLCRVVALQAADSETYDVLGEAFQAIGDGVQAVRAYDCAIHLASDRWGAYAAAATVSEERGWYNRARRYHDALSRVPGRRAAALEGLSRVAAAWERAGKPAADPPDAPPEQAELQGFVPPVGTGDAPPARRGRPTGPPPSLDDLISNPPPPFKPGPGRDGFGTSASAEAYLAEFRDPLAAAAAAEAEAKAAAELAEALAAKKPPEPPPEPPPPADPLARLRGALSDQIRKRMK